MLEPVPRSEHKTKSVFDLVHLDFLGPYKVTSKESYKYVLTIVDDLSRFMWVYMLRSSDEILSNIVDFHNLVKNQYNKRVKVFKSNNGVEFVTQKINDFCKSEEVVHHISCVYTQKNRVIEWKLKHLINVARCLLFQGGIPFYLWNECILTAVYLINRTPLSVLNWKSPFEIVYGFEPTLSHLRNFGCLSSAPKLVHFGKIRVRSNNCILLGYSSSKKRYKLFSLDDKHIIFSSDVQFYEDVYPFKSIWNNQYLSFNNVINHLNFFDSPYFDLLPNEKNIAQSILNDSKTSSNLDEVANSTETYPIVESCMFSWSERWDLAESLRKIKTIYKFFNKEHVSNFFDIVTELGRNFTVGRKFNEFITKWKVKFGIEKVGVG